MINKENEIFNSQLRAGNRTYFFDLKKTSQNKKYLVITESRKMSENEFKKNNIMIFEEDMRQFYLEIKDFLERMQ